MSQSKYDLRQERKKEALNYHSEGKAGKSEVVPTKPCSSARDLANAYSPGVAWPCREIADNPELAYKYTNRGNLVAVISNGSAVLGLGNIGALAGKPVMEGKGVLFKKFADIDVFDIEINQSSVEEMTSTIKALEPTFGGINLEDIKSPECFELEKILKKEMNIPVFHDDQHGTAIISSAAFINAIEITGKKIGDVKVVYSGAGAASIACAKLFLKMGVKKENLYMCDSKGVIYEGRKERMNKYKQEFALQTDARTLADAINGADAFIGLSMKGVLTKEMVKTMNSKPIIFAMANPDPEILPEDVKAVRDDAIMATGRSDYPNQVNNVLGFPFIFRGALDVRATTINEEMKLAAVYAIAELARDPITEDVKMAYGNQHFSFGPEYLIPKPFDRRVLTKVAPAVAKAAMDSNVAQNPIEDLIQYALLLDERLGNASGFLNDIRSRLPKKNKSKILFTEGANQKILEAVSILKDEGIIKPVVFGRKSEITSLIKEHNIPNLNDLEIIYPSEHPKFTEYVDTFYQMRQRKGVSIGYAKATMRRASYFGSMMVKKGDADGMITGMGVSYAKAFKPVIRVIGSKNKKASGVMILNFKHKVVFLADCTLQIDPSSEDLVQIALNTYELYRSLHNRNPRIAFLSYSNFGSNKSKESIKINKAVSTLQSEYPDMIVDGEMQADIAVNHQLSSNLFNFSKLDKSADILIFPNLSSANISYKLLAQLGGATPIGPVITPIQYPINILQRTASVEEIISITHLTAITSSRKMEHLYEENY